MTDAISLLIAAAGGYFLGSIPFGLVLTRLFGYGDIRTIGSGNIGATNVLRTGNKPLAFLVLILDSGKGAIAVLAARFLLPELGLSDSHAPIFAGVAAVFGHNFPVWLGFKGGKGIATTLGTLTAIHWPVGLAACATWLVVALIFRFSSLSALICLAAVPMFALVPVLGGPNHEIAWAGFVLAVLGWVRHHSNIRRLINGTEPRIGGK